MTPAERMAALLVAQNALDDAMAAQHPLIGGMPRLGKSAGHRQLAVQAALDPAEEDQ